MTLLVDGAVKVSVVILAALAACALLRRHSGSARHWVLSAAIVCAAAIPPLGLVVPPWHLAAARPATPAAAGADEATAITYRIGPPAGSTVQPTAPRRRFAAGDRLAAVRRSVEGAWLAGVVLSLGLLAAGLTRLASIASRSTPLADDRWTRAASRIGAAYGLRRRVTLLVADHPTLLVTWGAWRPKIVLPAGALDWPDERIHVVLSHELAHVARADWPVQMLAEVLRSCFWFNPLLWIACARLRQDSEHAADEAVLALGVEGRDYAEQLADLAQAFSRHRRTWLPAPGIAYMSDLERRIAAMLNDNLNRRPLARPARAAVVLALAAITLPLAGLAAQQFATVSGTIADQSGGILTDVTLTLSNVQTRAKNEIRSDATGAFQFVGLPPGDYLLEARLLGFANLRDTLTLSGGQTLQRSITMRVGSLQETLTVTETNSKLPPPGGGAVRPLPAWAQKQLDEPCTPSPVGGRIVPPVKLRDVRPQYPESVRTAGDTRVVLEARIGTDGFVKEVKTTPPVAPDVDSAASAAVSQWQFTPTFLNCAPVDVNMTVTILFKSPI